MEKGALLKKVVEYLEGGLFHLLLVILLIYLFKYLDLKTVFTWALAGAFVVALVYDIFKRRSAGIDVHLL